MSYWEKWILQPLFIKLTELEFQFLFLSYIMLDVAGLQNEDGSFSGDIWGEVDTR
jgi:hypothetical protein